MGTAEHRPFGAVLRGYRVAAGLSQEELAARAQLSRRTISDLERGVTSAPYRSTVGLLAAALGLDAAQRAALERAARLGGGAGRARAAGTRRRAGHAGPLGVRRVLPR